MLAAMLAVVLLVVALLMLVRGRVIPGVPSIANRVAPFVMIVIALILFATRSFVIIDSDEVGHLKKVYLGSDLAPGAIIAADGEKGPQAEVLPPGFHFIPFVRILYEVEYSPVLEINEGTYGLLLARDGTPLRADQFLADPWHEETFQKMLNARHFLTEGSGQKGPQLSVLRPGKYRLNQYLFDVKALPALDVPTGHVAVIRSNVQTIEDCPDVLETAKGGSNEQVATPIVPKGCIGVWEEPLPPGRYYLNERAYVPTIIPTRLQTWTYKGGYKQRQINLRVNDNGKIEQQEEVVDVDVPQDAADRAIMVRVEGWTVPVEMRAVVQVHPKDASRVVASVGDLQRVEDSIITPAIRDILRSIGGHPERRVLDFIEKRDEITSLVEKAVAVEGVKAGVTIQEVRMGEPAVPPELLVARLREQLAGQLKETYEREREAQNERIETERARATADQQDTLVEAEIAKKAAEFRKEQARLEGEGEKLRQLEIAQGQKAMADVLGQDRTLQFQILKETLAVAKENPDIIKVPTVQVLGSEGGYEGAAAVLGASNFVQMMQGIKDDKAK